MKVKKKIIACLFLCAISLFSYSQIRFTSPQRMEDTYYIKLYKDKCTEGKCRDGNSGTQSFKSYGKFKDFTGEFGPENSFKNGVLSFNNGDVYEGTFYTFPTSEYKSKYSHLNVEYDSGIYKCQDGTRIYGKFRGNMENMLVKLSNGAEYKGKLTNYCPDGYGVLIYADGGKYSGYWKDGLREGKGEILDKNNQLIASGNFENNHINGIGIKMIHGDMVKGKMVNGFASGIYEVLRPGTQKNILRYYKNDTLIYDTLLQMGDNYCISGNCANGKGKMLDSSYFVYEGDLKNGKKEGTGIQAGRDISYTGSFKNDERNGKGKIAYPDGSFYDGDWEDGYRTGEGYYEWGTDDYFKGHWIKNKREGKGYRHNSKGYIYEGNYKNDLPDGKGKVTFENGDKYEGDWAEGDRTGYGTDYYANGNKYEGRFYKNFYAGKGVFTFSSGGVYESDTWNGDNFSQGFYTRNGEAAVAGVLKDFKFKDVTTVEKEKHVLSADNSGGPLLGTVVVVYNNGNNIYSYFVEVHTKSNYSANQLETLGQSHVSSQRKISSLSFNSSKFFSGISGIDARKQYISRNNVKTGEVLYMNL